jgi:hypothetical protein
LKLLCGFGNGGEIAAALLLSRNPSEARLFEARLREANSAYP